MTKDPKDIADYMRSAADLLENHGEDIPPLLDSLISEGEESDQAISEEGNPPLAEVHETDSGFLVVAELTSDDISELMLKDVDDGLEIITDEDMIVAKIEPELDMTDCSVSTNNGIVEVAIKEVE